MRRVRYVTHRRNKWRFNMVITIDRIEKDTLVIELADGQMIDVPRALIPDAQEGFIYDIKKIDLEMGNRKQRIERKMNKLFNE